MCGVRPWCREYRIALWPGGAAGVSKAAFLSHRQPSGRDQPIQLRVWTELTRPARARRRQLQHRAACLPVDGSTGGAHCYLARGNSLREGGPLLTVGVDGCLRSVKWWLVTVQEALALFR